jgi:membrane protease YdiL (CAAX protease family)
MIMSSLDKLTKLKKIMPKLNQEVARKPFMHVVYLVAAIALPGCSILLLPNNLGAIVAGLVILAVIILAGYLKGTGTKDLGLIRPKSWIRTIGLGIGYALLMYVALRIFVAPALELWTGEERNLSRFDFLIGNTPALIKTIVMFWITAGFLEEVIFRGFLMSNTAAIFRNSSLGWGIGLVFSSILFALSHGYQGLSGVLLTGIAGFVFGLLFLKHRDNLWILIIAHGLVDTISALLIYWDLYEEIGSWIFC